MNTPRQDDGERAPFMGEEREIPTCEELRARVRELDREIDEHLTWLRRLGGPAGGRQ